MINQTLHNGFNPNKQIPFGIRLKSAREALGMDRKEVAAQLRLHEKVISMIESGEFKSDLPLTFIRGYIRNYSKLLEIPEQEVQEALEMLKPKPEIEEQPASSNQTPQLSAVAPSTQAKPGTTINIGSFFMQLFTYLLAITLIGLVGIWWHSHKNASLQNASVMAEQIKSDTENQPAAPPSYAPDSPRQSDSNNAGTMINRTSATDAGPIPPPNAQPENASAPSQDTAAPSTDAAADASRDNSADNSPDASLLNHDTDQTIPGQSQAGKTNLSDTSSFPTSKSDPSIFAAIATGLNGLDILANLIMFLLVIVLGMRVYATSSLNSAMAGMRVSRTSQTSPNIARKSANWKFPSKLPVNWTLVFFGIIVLVSLIGLGNALWHRHAKGQAVSAPPATKTPGMHTASRAVKPEPAPSRDTFDIEDINIQLPNPNLSGTLFKASTTNALQALTNELDALASEADATYFSLTDKSTPIGQFNPAKKRHKKHKTSHVVSDTKPESQNKNPAPPYYYYQQYNRAP